MNYNIYNNKKNSKVLGVSIDFLINFVRSLYDPIRDAKYQNSKDFADDIVVKMNLKFIKEEIEKVKFLNFTVEMI